MRLKIDRCVLLIIGFKDKLYHLKGIRPLRDPFKAWYSRINQWYPFISGFPWLFQVYMSKIAVHDRPSLQPTCDFLVFIESISINSGQKCPTSTNLIVFNLVKNFGLPTPLPFRCKKILFRAFFELFSQARFGSWVWWRHYIYENSPPFNPP